MTLVTDRDVLLRRLQWRATRRGLLELDEWFSRFLKRDFETLSDAECETFVLLLEEPDPHLYAWLLGVETPPVEYAALIKRITARE